MPDLPTGPIDHPAAWRGIELAERENLWTWSLTEPEVAELETAARAYLARNETIGEIAPDEFPLPSLGSNLLALRETLLHGIGFQLVRGLPVNRYDIRTSAAIFCGIGAHLGVARSQNAHPAFTPSSSRTTA